VVSRERQSTLLSCLSAHAALTVFDDIARIRLPTKCTGVFPRRRRHSPSHRRDSSRRSSFLTRAGTRCPERLEHAGYDVVVQSEDDGLGRRVARREVGTSLVLVQGHPEYDPSSLLREYRRDAGRYVRHERDDLPFLPYHCVITRRLGVTRAHCTTRSSTAFAIRYSSTSIPSTRWASSARGRGDRWPIRFYANWLTSVDEAEEE
jgi:hypothetical protein